MAFVRSNNTNKLSPQEHPNKEFSTFKVQIIQINLVLKNILIGYLIAMLVQIIQINLVLKNPHAPPPLGILFK